MSSIHAQTFSFEMRRQCKKAGWGSMYTHFGIIHSQTLPRILQQSKELLTSTLVGKLFDAAQCMWWSVVLSSHWCSNVRILGPLTSGDYPEVMKKIAGSRLPSFTKHQSEQIKGSFDYIGLNHYASSYVKDNPDAIKINPRDFSLDILATISS